ncbi:hypothetical protein ES288_D13G073500v1 [Gossypium darwinii]|uniref:Uncharacterized protein n=1 Tax=Gossypium darwinii TaxID=34276 RepID=A0A5D1ZYW6_GOSDA|nr:hypothetical protein ES288_D13G073500v1 [Gossypium darwinii]
MITLTGFMFLVTSAVLGYIFLSKAGIATTCYYLTLSSTRDDEDDSVAKMKAAEEALEAKQKVTNSLSAT